MKNSISFIFSSILIFIIISFSLITSIYGQKEVSGKSDWYIEPSIRYGQIIPNYASTLNLAKIFGVGTDLRFGLQTHGKNEWEQWTGYPSYGFVVRYLYYGNDYGILQGKVAIFPFISGNFLTYRAFSLKYQLGSGLVYFFNPYHYQKNKENLFIATYLSAHIDLHVALEFQLSQRLDLALRCNLSHSSNGAIRYPNYGINQISGQLALKYHLFQTPERINTIDTISSYKPKNSFYFFIAPSFRQSKNNYVYGTEDKFSSHIKYFATTLQLGYMRQFHPFFRFGGGVDLMYSSELRTFFPRDQRNESLYITAASFLSFEFLYKRVAIHTSLAAYFHRKANFYTWFYERAGVKVMLGKEYNHFVGASIKAHSGTIDYVEWIYGYQFVNWYDKKERTLRPKKNWRKEK